MSSKNLDSYRSIIEDIDAERIKERLLARFIEDPNQEMKNIARIAINLGLAVSRAPESTVDMDQVFGSFMNLESYYNFFDDLTNSN